MTKSKNWCSLRIIDDALGLFEFTHYFDTVLCMDCNTTRKYINKDSEYKYRRSFQTLHMTYIHEARRIPRPFDVLGGIKFQN